MLFNFQVDSARMKVSREKIKSKNSSEKDRKALFNQNKKVANVKALSITETVENNPIDAAGLALPTEFFGPIQKRPLYKINQNVSIRPDTTPGVSNTKSYRKEGRIHDISHNGIEYIYRVTILLGKSTELV